METYFYMDHARNARVRYCPNLVSESQMFQNHVISEENESQSLGMLFCEETLYVLENVFVKILTGKHEKD